MKKDKFSLSKGLYGYIKYFLHRENLTKVRVFDTL
jgi:hypothetical protein